MIMLLGVQPRQLPSNSTTQLQQQQQPCHNQHPESILMQIMDMVQPPLGRIIILIGLQVPFQPWPLKSQAIRHTNLRIHHTVLRGIRSRLRYTLPDHLSHNQVLASILQQVLEALSNHHSKDNVFNLLLQMAPLDSHQHQHRINRHAHPWIHQPLFQSRLLQGLTEVDAKEAGWETTAED